MSSAHTDALEALLQSGNATSPEFKGALSRLSADLRERLARGAPTSTEVFARAIEALARIKGGRHAELRMSCLFDCVHFFYITGHAKLALQAARQLISLANQMNDKKWTRKAHNMLGIVHADSGNVAEAIVDYSSALTIASAIGDSEGELLGFLNLGVALNYSGLYREAIPCLQKAVQLSQSDSQLERHCGAALANLAQSYWYLDEPLAGFKAICSSLDNSKEPTDSVSALSRTVREFTYVQLSLDLGKVALAREHSESCSQYGRQSGTIRTEYMAAIASSLCEIHGGNVERGLSQLESLLVSSDDIGATRSDALIALVRAYDEASQPERALVHMKSLLQHIRGMREKGLLALIEAPHYLRHHQQVPGGSHDLRALEFLEAKLRAQVSEREVVNSRIEILERFAVTADLKEEASGEHGYRVGRLAALVGTEIGYSGEQCTALDVAARLHDLGKISVPDRILLNSKELKDAERHFVSMHTMIGAELLAKSNIPQLRLAEEIARHHHEWWDGTGYPSKLSGNRIPIHARIAALADVFDALTHGRPFSPPWTMDRAIEEIRNRRGTQFDPELTDVFLALIEKLRAEHSDLDAYLGKAGKSSPFLQARNKIRLMLAEERENERKATVVGNDTRH